jgi:hypothetical protein
MIMAKAPVTARFRVLSVGFLQTPSQDNPEDHGFSVSLQPLGDEFWQQRGAGPIVLPVKDASNFVVGKVYEMSFSPVEA